MIEGQIPDDIEGTLFRNGAGLFQRAGVRVAQPFDGDGMINKFSIKQGKVHYMNKFVRTQEYLKEEECGKFIFRTLFSKTFPHNKNPFHIKQVANTSVLQWAGKLFAMFEIGPPYELDPITLKTIGVSNVFNSLKNRGVLVACIMKV
eukprot:TRINITY_DN17933_c0_g3_i1.p2 TRINITY_DN17933_c0_g3~~TRINITY_DN17933_c0_g3_i1.p2  ORF type:complete len:147 (-),score=16.02 TRINITY_DN17933_c0_g3_i1:10-450(-)